MLFIINYFIGVSSSVGATVSINSSARLMGIINSPESFDYNFGWGVSITDNYLVVGDPVAGLLHLFNILIYLIFIYIANYDGRAYIYELNSTLNSWSLIASLRPDDSSNLTYFGNGVWIYKNYASVGAPHGIPLKV